MQPVNHCVMRFENTSTGSLATELCSYIAKRVFSNLIVAS